MDDVELKKIAMLCVDAVLVRSGVSVEKRQSINDDCDTVVLEIIKRHLTKRAPDGATAPRIFRTVDQIFKHYIKGYARPPRR